MKRVITICLVSMIMIVSGLSGLSNGVTVTVDPDAFPAGTVLNNAYPGVTLTALGEPGVLPNSNVVAIASVYASTGSNVFGDTETGNPESWGNGSYDWLRVDFAGGASKVSLAFITNDEGDNNAVLRAYDINGFEVDSDGPYYVPGPAGTYRTLMVSAPYIAWIETEWDKISRVENGMLDNLTYTPVPEPATIVLIGLGALSLLRKKRGV
jgi:hypothetical protein